MQNTSRMLDHKVLVRKAVGIKTAGFLNILFSDKTGTITKGSLEVVEFFTPDGERIPLDEMHEHGKVKSLVDIAIGKNTASMFDGEHRVIGGNATDQALMRFLGEDKFMFLSKGTDKESDYSVGLYQGFNSANIFNVQCTADGLCVMAGSVEKNRFRSLWG